MGSKTTQVLVAPGPVPLIIPLCCLSQSGHDQQCLPRTRVREKCPDLSCGVATGPGGRPSPPCVALSASQIQNWRLCGRSNDGGKRANREAGWELVVRDSFPIWSPKPSFLLNLETRTPESE